MHLPRLLAAQFFGCARQNPEGAMLSSPNTPNTFAEFRSLARILEAASPQSFYPSLPRLSNNLLLDFDGRNVYYTRPSDNLPRIAIFLPARPFHGLLQLLHLLLDQYL
jgi:hypothetical protein